MKRGLIAVLILALLVISVVGCRKVTQAEYNVDKNSCNGCGAC